MLSTNVKLIPYCSDHEEALALGYLRTKPDLSLSVLDAYYYKLHQFDGGPRYGRLPDFVMEPLMETPTVQASAAVPLMLMQGITITRRRDFPLLLDLVPGQTEFELEGQLVIFEGFTTKEKVVVRSSAGERRLLGSYDPTILRLRPRQIPSGVTSLHGVENGHLHRMIGTQYEPAFVTLIRSLHDIKVRGVNLLQLVQSIFLRNETDPYSVLIVGGAVRDAMRGAPANDVDLVVQDTYANLSRFLTDHFAEHGESVNSSSLLLGSKKKEFGQMKVALLKEERLQRLSGKEQAVLPLTLDRTHAPRLMILTSQFANLGRKLRFLEAKSTTSLAGHLQLTCSPATSPSMPFMSTSSITPLSSSTQLAAAWTT